LCRRLTSPLVSSPVALSPLATAPFTTATGRRRCDVPWPRRHRLWQRRVRPFGCVAIACGVAVHYRVWDVTAVTSPGCVATACGLAVCCRCWASPLVSSSVASSPLARAPFTAVGRHRLCRLVTPPLVASSVASSPPATAPFTTVAGRRRRDVSELRCHRLWRRRVQPSGCVAIACGGAVYYRDGASLLWRLLRHHRLW
jgi:hypothetical protein